MARVAMTRLAMALLALVMVVVSLLPLQQELREPSLADHPGRSLKATDSDGWVRDFVPEWDCLDQQLGRTFDWIWGVAADLLQKHWVSLLMCPAAAAVLYVVKRSSANPGAAYELLKQFDNEMESDKVDKLYARGEILYMACLWLFDMGSDIYVIITYYRERMYVFSSLLALVWMGSGFAAFLYRYFSWKKCEVNTNIEYYWRGLDDQGRAKPGFTLLVSYLMQLEPVVMAYGAWKEERMTCELREEKAMTALCEGAPSALLQLYALLVDGPQNGNPLILSGSIAMSILTVAEGVNRGYDFCLPAGKQFEAGKLPKVAVTAFRFCDVLWRISIWALLGFALRPVDAKRHGVQQPYLPFLMCLELVLVCLLFKLSLGLRKWSDIFQKQYFVGSICCFLSTFWCCYDEGLVPQQRFSRTLLAMRSLQSFLTLWFCALIYSATVGGECILAGRPTVSSIALVAVGAGCVTVVVAAINDLAQSCCALPLFPVIAGWNGGRQELAARVGLASQLAAAEESELVAALCQAAEAGHISVVKAICQEFQVTANATCDSGATAMHFAAKRGHVNVMETLQALGSNDLETADGQKETPVHCAALNGHLEVLQFLQRSGCDLQPANSEGWAPVHYAADCGHLEILKFLDQSGCNLETARGDGATPAFVAAFRGQLDVLKFLKLKGCNLETPDQWGWHPSHIAGEYGHAEVVKFLQLSGCDLEAKRADDGATPAYTAAVNGHLGVLKVFHDAGCNLNTAKRSGLTPAGGATKVGRVEVLQFLQSLGWDFETANTSDGATVAHVAADKGHLEILKFLQRSGCKLDATRNDGATPAQIAASNGHLEILQFLQLSGVDVPKGSR